MTAPYDSPLPCDQPSCTGVIQCRECHGCSDHCICVGGENYDPTPWELDSGPSGPTASERAAWQRLK